MIVTYLGSQSLENMYMGLVFSTCVVKCAIFSSKQYNENSMAYIIDVCTQFWGHGEGIGLLKRLLKEILNCFISMSLHMLF